MKPIFVPALTGKFGDWRFYEAIVSVEFLTKCFDGKESSYFVKTVSEVEEIYSKKGVSNLLQRAFDKKRLAPLKNYILSQPDKYINNLTIAMFDGDPEWISIGMRPTSLAEKDESKSDSYWEEISKSFGIIKLTGNEKLFVLDGQHRIMALRQAIIEDSKLLNDTVAVTFISHSDSSEGREKTRRLFTTINRYAKPVSFGENILLDEDDLSAILARKLIENYPKFVDSEVIALNKTANLNKHEKDKFTSVIAIYNLNEKIIPKSVYPKLEGGSNSLVRIRPADEVIEKYQAQVFQFWDVFFESFPNLVNHIKDRNFSARDHGGPYYFRPIGQLMFCDYYLEMLKSNRIKEIETGLKKIPENINDPFWHFVLWNPIQKKVIQNYSYSKNYFFYKLGFDIGSMAVANLTKQFRKYSGNLTAEISQVE